MTKNKKSILPYFLTLIPLLSLGQIEQRVNLKNGSDNTSRVIYNREYRNSATDIKYSYIKGSPYLNDSLTIGKIRLLNGDSIISYMRYDMYADEIEFLKNEKLYTVYNKSELDYIIIGDITFIYTKYIDDNQFIKGYLIELIKDKVSLFSSKHVQFISARPPQTMPYSEASPAKFSQVETKWYFAINKQPISQFDTNNEGIKLISLNNDIYRKLKQYIKINKLKIKRKEDLIKLIIYYNSLLE